MDKKKQENNSEGLQGEGVVPSILLGALQSILNEARLVES